MIQPEELRIGNHVSGALGKLYKVDINLLTCVNANPDWVDPIPLTPELLERCGFEKSKEEVYGEEYLGLKLNNGIGNYEICFFPGNTFKTISLFHKGDLIGRTWEYLHQLQNLYFSLTGKELQFNPVTEPAKQSL